MNNTWRRSFIDEQQKFGVWIDWRKKTTWTILSLLSSLLVAVRNDIRQMAFVSADDRNLHQPIKSDRDRSEGALYQITSAPELHRKTHPHMDENIEHRVWGAPWGSVLISRSQGGCLFWHKPAGPRPDGWIPREYGPADLRVNDIQWPAAKTAGHIF